MSRLASVLSLAVEWVPQSPVEIPAISRVLDFYREVHDLCAVATFSEIHEQWYTQVIIHIELGSAPRLLRRIKGFQPAHVSILRERESVCVCV